MSAQAESALQVQCADYLDRALTGEWRWWHTPNGEKRDARTGARLRAMGVKPGVPDIIVAGPRREGVIFFELKSKSGRMEAEQKTFERWAGESGWPYFICRSVDEVERHLDRLGVPLRARMVTFRAASGGANQ